MKIKNLYLALKDQGPPLRFIRNFFITRNAWGLFSINSHIVQSTGKEKIKYNTKSSSIKASQAMMKKHSDSKFSPYKCIYCDGYHIGKTKIKQ